MLYINYPYINVSVLNYIFDYKSNSQLTKSY